MYFSVELYILVLPYLTVASDIDFTLFVEKKNATYNSLCLVNSESVGELSTITWISQNVSDDIKSIEYCRRDLKFEKEVSLEYSKNGMKKASYYFNVPRVINFKWNEFPVFNQKLIINRKKMKVIHFSVRIKNSSVLTIVSQNKQLCVDLQNVKEKVKLESCESVIPRSTISVDGNIALWKHYSIFNQSNQYYITDNFKEMNKNLGTVELERIILDGQIKWHNYTILNISNFEFEKVFENGVNFSANSCLRISAYLSNRTELFIHLKDTNNSTIYNATVNGEDFIWKEIHICDAGGKNANLFLMTKGKKVFIGAIALFEKSNVRYLNVSTTNKYIGCQIINSTQHVKYIKPIKFVENDININATLDLYANLTKSDMKNVVFCQKEGCYCLSAEAEGMCSEKCENDKWGGDCENLCLDCELCDDTTGVCLTKTGSFNYLLIIPIVIAGTTLIIIVICCFARKRTVLVNSNRVDNEDSLPLYEKTSVIFGKLDEEFKDIPKINEKYSQIVGKKETNKFKNRYADIIPYDHNRVKLESNNGCYINASYIPGYKGGRTYIATQCPKHITINSFWRMIWQENVAIIICLASFDEDQMVTYWKDNDEQTCKDLTVTHLKTKTLTDFVIRSFSLKNETNESKTVLQVHYISWPDYEIPMFPLSFLMFLRYVQSRDKTRAPLVVHCSAGVGRTGTYIMCDQLIRQDGDICRNLTKIRNYRPSLVANKKQYRLIHFIINESREDNEYWKSTTMDLIEFRYENRRIDLNKVWSLLQLKEKKEDILEREYVTEIYLPSNDSKRKTIEATYVDGYQKSNKFILTKYPNAVLLENFWSLVKMKQIKTVIVLGNPLYKFWPTDNSTIYLSNNIDVSFLSQEETKGFKHFLILLTSSTTENNIIELNISLLNISLNQEVIVENLSIFYEYYQQMLDQKDTFLLCCSDGYTHCGLFITLDLVLSKLINDKLFDLVWAARGVTFCNKKIVNTKETLSIIYDVAKLWTEFGTIDQDRNLAAYYT